MVSGHCYAIHKYYQYWFWVLVLLEANVIGYWILGAFFGIILTLVCLIGIVLLINGIMQCIWYIYNMWSIFSELMNCGRLLLYGLSGMLIFVIFEFMSE